MTNRVKAEPLTSRPAGLEALVAAWPFKPFQWLEPRSSPGLAQLALERLWAALRQPAVRAWSVDCRGELQGIALLQPLEWDSNVLGISAARLEVITADVVEPPLVAAALIDAVIDEAKRLRIRHLSVRLDAGDDGALLAVEERGFLNVDALQTFGAPVEHLPASLPSGSVVLRPALPSDSIAVGEIAAASFRHGRFHADPAIAPEQAQAVYRTWARACCAGSAAYGTIIAAVEGETVGFVACRISPDTAVHLRRPVGTITLIATTAAMRGRGVGSALVAGAAAWFRTRQAAAVEVGTQLRNVAAARLYERCGLRPVSGSRSFRLMIER
jgi:dTDP-4-amino-4,6-dideoxy-D-galactose acyltransferase